jgi:hypothetical protein
MRDPDLVMRAQRAAAALETAWNRWRTTHGLGADPLPPVSSYVGYSLEEPWGQPRVVFGVDAEEAEQLAAVLDRLDHIGPVQAEPARPDGGQKLSLERRFAPGVSGIGGASRPLEHEAGDDRLRAPGQPDATTEDQRAVPQQAGPDRFAGRDRLAGAGQFAAEDRPGVPDQFAGGDWFASPDRPTGADQFTGPHRFAAPQQPAASHQFAGRDPFAASGPFAGPGLPFPGPDQRSDTDPFAGSQQAARQNGSREPAPPQPVERAVARQWAAERDLSTPPNWQARQAQQPAETRQAEARQAEARQAEARAAFAARWPGDPGSQLTAGAEGNGAAHLEPLPARPEVRPARLSHAFHPAPAGPLDAGRSPAQGGPDGWPAEFDQPAVVAFRPRPEPAGYPDDGNPADTRDRRGHSSVSADVAGWISGELPGQAAATDTAV